MTNLATLAAWIKLIPTFVNLAMETWKAIQSGIDWVVVQESMSKFKSAVKTAKETKDTTKLENMYGGG
jgi:hypothetical protein